MAAPSVAGLEGFAGRRVLVVGDAILDRYLKGSIERISPEAPVPVVRLRTVEDRLGGAANVAHNVVTLGADAELIAVVGHDAAATALQEALAARRIGVSGLVRAAGRPTTLKSRVLAQHQQVLRIDEEEDGALPDEVVARVVRRALDRLRQTDVLVLSDYAKGLIDARLTGPLLEAARAHGVPTIVDPKSRDLGRYAPATVVTPNWGEALLASGFERRDAPGPVEVARALLARYPFEAVLLTLGEAGMLLAPRDGEPLAIPAQAREVFDVTGAGDTVVAMLAVALAAGQDLPTAARWANLAAGVAVGRLGTAAVGLDDLRNAAAASGMAPPGGTEGLPAPRRED